MCWLILFYSYVINIFYSLEDYFLNGYVCFGPRCNGEDGCTVTRVLLSFFGGCAGGDLVLHAPITDALFVCLERANCFTMRRVTSS